MRILYLLRHAKAVRPDDGIEDHERPLTPRGVRASGEIGRWLARAELPAPELALCSTARRVADTFGGILPHLERAPLVLVDRELYLASAGRILDAIQRVEDRHPAILVVGHNPGLHTLVTRLTGSGDRDAARRLQHKFPTAALAVLRFPVGSWRDVESGGGELVHFVTPRSLEG